MSDGQILISDGKGCASPAWPWVSVEDKLPNRVEYDSVLVTNGEHCYVALEWWPGEKPLETSWSYSDCCGCSIPGRVTHWMPLPAPPTEDE